MIDVAIVVGHARDKQNITSADGTTEWAMARELADQLLVRLEELGLSAKAYERDTRQITYRTRMRGLVRRINYDEPRGVVALHWDSRTKEHAWYSGTQALYWPHSVPGRALAKVVSKSAAKSASLPNRGAVAQGRSWSTYERDELGVPRPTGPLLYILGETHAPATLLEVCNAHRPADAIQLLEALAAGTLARHLAHALADHLRAA